MRDAINRQWLLKSRPEGPVTEDNFDYRESAVPTPGPGQVLVKTEYLSFDPTFRGQMMDMPNYVPPMQIGDVMRGGSTGRVIESNDPRFKPGDRVTGSGGWQDYFLSPGSDELMGLSHIPDGVSDPHAMSIFGITGLTAYFGLLDIGQPREGETVLISGAAGATGSVVGQIAKLKGCRVVGIAGGEAKCNWLVNELGFDAVIDYKADHVYRRMRELCPGGIDIYFENVGGDLLEAALGCLAQRARIVLCGGISSYDTGLPPKGPRSLLNLIGTRSRMEGFLVLDYSDRFPEAISEMSGWMREGKLLSLEDIQQGFENAPRTFMRLFSGQNFGKQLLKV